MQRKAVRNGSTPEMKAPDIRYCNGTAWSRRFSRKRSGGAKCSRMINGKCCAKPLLVPEAFIEPRT
jgi:hypothetical protein